MGFSCLQVKKLSIHFFELRIENDYAHKNANYAKIGQIGSY